MSPDSEATQPVPAPNYRAAISQARQAIQRGDRLEALGAPSSMFCRLLPAMTGQEARVSNTALVRTLSLAARAFYAESIAAQSLHWAPLPGDAGARWEACVVPRSWTADSPSARTLMVSLRPAPLPKGAQQ